MKSPLYYFLVFLILCVAQHVTAQEETRSLTGKVICLDAGHGGTAETDSFRKGPSGEREEWINLRVALILEELLKEEGARVVMTRRGDDTISLSRRAQIAKENKADLFLSIHHNATADPEVNFPIIYFHGYASENNASVVLGKEIAEALASHLYEGQTPVSIVSDHTIFPNSGTGVLRGTYGIPGVIGEASFFTNPAEEKRLKDSGYNRREALGYLKAIKSFFERSVPPIVEKNALKKLPPFQSFQEAERMNETALSWYQDYLKGKELMKQEETQVLEEAYDLLTRSARSFPDSYVAADCHKNRASLLERLGRPDEAAIAAERAREFYAGN